jgi:hypothetical protein
MYSTCLFCHADLGRNEELEPFPVGERIAYDPERGRLWVVCRRCERWNLSPLEERWEALEESERKFRATKLRVSTDNIGLARLPSGMELVRVGRALRPELAAWRYGDQFGHRRRKHMMLTGASIVVGGAFLVAGPMMGLLAGGSWGLFNLANTFYSLYAERRVRTRLIVPGEQHPVVIRRRHLGHAQILPGPAPSEWLLRVAFASGMQRTDSDDSGASPEASTSEVRYVDLRGADALSAASRILPHINQRGGDRSTVQRAVTNLETHGSAAKLYAMASRRRGPHNIDYLPLEMRLALEMATHEESERRAMEGELALLEAAWREAEEIAAIADNLFTPEPQAAPFRAVGDEPR